MPSLSKAGAKIRQWSRLFQIFSPFFFIFFPSTLATTWIAKRYTGKFFFHGTCPDHGKNGRWPGNPARDGEKIDENSNRGKGTTGGKGRQKEHEDPTLPYQGHPRTPLIRLWFEFDTPLTPVFYPLTPCLHPLHGVKRGMGYHENSTTTLQELNNHTRQCSCYVHAMKMPCSWYSPTANKRRGKHQQEIVKLQMF